MQGSGGEVLATTVTAHTTAIIVFGTTLSKIVV